MWEAGEGPQRAALVFRLRLSCHVWPKIPSLTVPLGLLFIGCQISPMSSDQQLADKQIGDKQLTGHFCGGGAWKGQWGDGFFPSDPNSSEPVFCTHGTGHSLPPCSSQALGRGRELANWYELWPRVIIFLRISEVAKQLKGLS